MASPARGAPIILCGGCLRLDELGQRTYVIAWVGDDSAENDGDPLTDGGGESNPGAGILAVRAEAFGVGGAHTVLEATVRQDTEGPGVPMVRMLSWQEVR